MCLCLLPIGITVAVSFVFLCACLRVLVPALLLNNPAYHVVLSDDRKGPRPLVVPSASQAQEKSLNVPQGKRAPKGPTEPGRAHSQLQTPLTVGAQMGDMLD